MTVREDPSSAVGQRQFELLRCLGRGGFGEVYHAAMTSPGGVRTEVAVKLLHQGLDPKSQAVQRLRDEGRLLGVLNHPAIVRVTDLVLLDGRIALITEYVDGADLERLIDAGKDPISPRATVEALGQVADALHAAYHAKGPDGSVLHLVHRDVKPANIRIGHHGDVKLLDFGIAHARDKRREAKTQTNAMVGSLPFMAPERIDDNVAIEPPGDIYSLGATLYEALTRKQLFGEVTFKTQCLYALDRGRHDAFLATQLAGISGVPPEVVAKLATLLAWEPLERPTARDFVRWCDEIAPSLPGPSLRAWCRDREWTEGGVQGDLDGKVITESGSAPAPRSSDTLDRDWERPRRGRGVMWATLALLTLLVLTVSGAAFVLGAGGLAWWATSTAPPPTPVQPLPAPVPVPVPVVAPVAPVPAPAEPVAAPPAPVAAPAPVSSTPKPVTPKKPDKPTSEPTGTVSVQGPFPVELRRGAVRQPPGPVATGTWEIWADMGSGFKSVGTANVTAGETVSFKCSRMIQGCVQAGQ